MPSKHSHSPQAPSLSAAMRTAYEAVPAKPRQKLLALRRLIFALAAQTQTGPLTETLKWGAPAYLTQQSKSGTTIRLGWDEAQPQTCQIYLNCKTDLIDRYRSLYPDEFTYHGNRCLCLPLDYPMPSPELESCLRMALTYHWDKKNKRKAS